MTRAVAGPLRLEGFTPLDRSLEMRVSRRYWEMRGAQAFVRREVPSDITNDGVRAGHAAAVLFENCLEADGAGALGETIDVLEIGVGTGLFARLLLRRFAALCAQQGRDFDQRLRYFATDVSEAALEALRDNNVLDGLRHCTVLATLDAMDPAAFTPLDAERARGWERPLQAVFHNYLFDVLPQSLLLRQGGWFELRVQTWLSDASRLVEAAASSAEEIQLGLAQGRPEAVLALAQAYRLIEVERGFFPVATADVPYGASVERFAASVLGDGDDVRLWVPFGAMRSLERTLPLLALSGFLLFTDYGPATVDEASTARTYQRYGAGVCIPLNFPLIAWHAGELGLRCIAPADDDLPLHARLITREALPRTEMRFRERFDGEVFRALERLIADARQLIGPNLPAARASFRRAAELAPENWLMLAEWAHMENEVAGDAEAALRIANAAIEINPACSPDLWCERGDALHKQGNPSVAASAYERALEIDPGHPRSQPCRAAQRARRLRRRVAGDGEGARRGCGRPAHEGAARTAGGDRRPPRGRHAAGRRTGMVPPVLTTARRLAAATLLVAGGCSDVAASRNGGDSVMGATREQAVERAMQAVRDVPRDPSRYEIETKETVDRWEIQFTGKPPRPPGDEVTVYIDKHTGALRLVLGE